MALKPCKECKKDISTEAKTCPNCGKRNPTQSASISTGAGCLLLLGVIFILSMVFKGNSGPSGTSAPSVTLEEQALAQVGFGFRWYKSGFDNVMMATFTFDNRGDRAVKDLTIRCVHSAPSGTVIDSNERTVYETVPAHKKRTVRDFNMGFIHSQATRTNCRITELKLG